MFRVNKVLIFILLKLTCLSNLLFAISKNCEHIELLLKQFNRPITLLEITENSAEYALEYAKKYNIICVILCLNNTDKKFVKNIKQQNLKNIIVLEPKNLNWHDIEILSRCEHFDVTIVHDFYNYFKNSSYTVLNSLLNLGDYIFFELKDQNLLDIKKINKNINKLNNINNNTLLFFGNKKQKLDLARFTQLNKPADQIIKYKIYSDFNQKLFFKSQVSKAIPWRPGINLVTFVMLRGIYPTNNIIYEKIKLMQNSVPYHNDLMIGNMIIQGHNIVPIDFEDSRRNANMANCIKRALRVFANNKRLKSPAVCMQRYYERKA